MSLLSRFSGEQRKQVLHYLLVGVTFLVCYFLFGYWNLSGGFGGRHGYGCYDLVPIQAHQQTADTLPTDELPKAEVVLD